MTLDAQEFIRRFLLHVLPSGFMRIRHYGLLANRAKGACATPNHHERPDSTDSQRLQAPASRPAADWLVLSRTVDPEIRICHSHRIY